MHRTLRLFLISSTIRGVPWVIYLSNRSFIASNGPFFPFRLSNLILLLLSVHSVGGRLKQFLSVNRSTVDYDARWFSLQRYLLFLKRTVCGVFIRYYVLYCIRPYTPLHDTFKYHGPYFILYLQLSYYKRIKIYPRNLFLNFILSENVMRFYYGFLTIIFKIFCINYKYLKIYKINVYRQFKRRQFQLHVIFIMSLQRV